jgi:hypothetical protein
MDQKPTYPMAFTEEEWNVINAALKLRKDVLTEQGLPKEFLEKLLIDHDEIIIQIEEMLNKQLQEKQSK